MPPRRKTVSPGAAADWARWMDANGFSNEPSAESSPFGATYHDEAAKAAERDKASSRISAVRGWRSSRGKEWSARVITREIGRRWRRRVTGAVPCERSSRSRRFGEFSQNARSGLHPSVLRECAERPMTQSVAQRLRRVTGAKYLATGVARLHDARKITHPFCHDPYRSI